MDAISAILWRENIPEKRVHKLVYFMYKLLSNDHFLLNSGSKHGLNTAVQMAG